MNKSQNSFSIMHVLPILFCFFAMGFVDLVGIASNYVKADLNISDAQANILLSLVFLWFLIFSIPTSLLMNKIGRKNTVLLSIAITFLGLLMPLVGDGFYTMVVAFSLLGIGNAIMQTSLNPLVSNIISEDKLASALTMGQFIKAIASFLAPIIAAWGASAAIPSCGLGWKILFLAYLAVSVIAFVALYSLRIKEETPDNATGFIQSVKLLGNPFVLLCFFGIICHVGIDVGTNVSAPKILMERFSMTLESAAFATSLYFICRTVSSFLGACFLRFVSEKLFFAISVLAIIVAMLTLCVSTSQTLTFVCIGLIGLGNSNLFSIVFAQALNAMPTKKNEVSGLMVMGIVGGAIFPPLMGIASDAIGQNGAIAVMGIAVLYLVFYTLKIKSVQA